MSRQRVQATSEAISTAKIPDANLLRLEAAFNANSDRERQAGEDVRKLEAEFDQLRKRMRKAERRQQRRTQEGQRLFARVMQARATSLEGIIAKVRIRERWNTDDEQTEIAVLKSLVRDLERIKPSS